MKEVRRLCRNRRRYHTMGQSSGEYHPSWDYAPNEDPNLMSMEAYESVFVPAQKLATEMGMGSIMLVFIEGDGVENHVAKYINGTSSSPIFVLADKVEDESEAVLTTFQTNLVTQECRCGRCGNRERR